MPFMMIMATDNDDHKRMLLTHLGQVLTKLSLNQAKIWLTAESKSGSALVALITDNTLKNILL